MDALSVNMFGGLQLVRNGIPIAPFPTRKSAALFSCLVLSRDVPIHRSSLCARLWGNQPDCSARKSLRTALWRVRRVVETRNAADTTYLTIDSQRVGFRENEGTAVDVWQFLDTAERFEALPFDRVLTVHEATSIERATGLFRGHLLEGESIFDEVTLIESERLTALQIGLLERLMLHHRRSENWHAAASTGHHILRLDNCREHVHREIMACHLATGDRPAAIRQFSACAATLAEELDIGPMRETLDLNDRIRSGALCDTTQIERKGCAIGEV